jgi:hypothetical protein
MYSFVIEMDIVLGGNLNRAKCLHLTYRELGKMCNLEISATFIFGYSFFLQIIRSEILTT